MFEKAKWIWVGENYKSEIYSDFYADFKIEFTSPDLLNKNLILNVAAENDYAAYLNGKLVSFNAFKGYPDLKFFNSAVLNDFLNEGKNELVFTVWHEGVNTSRSINSGAGVIFEGVLVEKNSEKPAYNYVNGTFAQESRKIETLFFSDKNVLSRQNPNFKSGNKKVITNQLGYTFLYDANKKNVGFNGWKNSAEINVKAQILPRPVKNLILNPPKKSTLIKSGKSGDKNIYLFDLGEETAGYLYLDFSSEKPQKLVISYSEKLNEKGETVRFVRKSDFSVEYIAKPGENVYFNVFLRLGLRYLQVECEEPVTVNKITVRPVEYPLETRRFTAENDDIKNVTLTAINTLSLCMHEHYEDCPWREQALYSLDSRNEMLCDYIAFKNNFDYARANLALIAKGVRSDGFLELTYPAVNTPAIPLYSLSFIVQLYEYVVFSGDKTIIEEVKPTAQKIMRNFRELADNGLIADFPYPFWNFYEWAYGSDNANDLKRDGSEKNENVSPRYSLILNAFYVYTEEKYAKIYPDDARDTQNFKNLIKNEFYDGESGLFFAYKGENFYTAFSNALAVLAGVAGEKTAEALISAKNTADCANNGGNPVKKQGGEVKVYAATLATAAFYYDALLSFGKKYENEVLNDILKTYNVMLDAGATTFWETLDDIDDPSCSLCHGWSALPIYYFALLNKIKFEK